MVVVSWNYLWYSCSIPIAPNPFVVVQTFQKFQFLQSNCVFSPPEKHDTMSGSVFRLAKANRSRMFRVANRSRCLAMLLGLQLLASVLVDSSHLGEQSVHNLHDSAADDAGRRVVDAQSAASSFPLTSTSTPPALASTATTNNLSLLRERAAGGDSVEGRSVESVLLMNAALLPGPPEEAEPASDESPHPGVCFYVWNNKGDESGDPGLVGGPKAKGGGTPLFSEEDLRSMQHRQSSSAQSWPTRPTSRPRRFSDGGIVVPARGEDSGRPRSSSEGGGGNAAGGGIWGALSNPFRERDARTTRTTDDMTSQTSSSPRGSYTPRGARALPFRGRRPARGGEGTPVVSPQAVSTQPAMSHSLSLDEEQEHFSWARLRTGATVAENRSVEAPRRTSGGGAGDAAAGTASSARHSTTSGRGEARTPTAMSPPGFVRTLRMFDPSTETHFTPPQIQHNVETERIIEAFWCGWCCKSLGPKIDAAHRLWRSVGEQGAGVGGAGASSRGRRSSRDESSGSSPEVRDDVERGDYHGPVFQSGSGHSHGTSRVEGGFVSAPAQTRMMDHDSAASSSGRLSDQKVSLLAAAYPSGSPADVDARSPGAFLGTKRNVAPPSGVPVVQQRANSETTTSRPPVQELMHSTSAVHKLLDGSTSASTCTSIAVDPSSLLSRDEVPSTPGCCAKCLAKHCMPTEAFQRRRLHGCALCCSKQTTACLCTICCSVLNAYAIPGKICPACLHCPTVETPFTEQLSSSLCGLVRSY